MELIPTAIILMLGAVFAVGALVAGTGRVTGGAHAAGPGLGARHADSWRAPSHDKGDS